MECVELFMKAGADDVNQGRKGLFSSNDDKLQYADGGKKELTVESDTENIKAIKRCADLFLNKDDGSAGEKLIELFQKAMECRKIPVFSGISAMPELSLLIWQRPGERCPSGLSFILLRSAS